MERLTEKLNETNIVSHEFRYVEKATGENGKTYGNYLAGYAIDRLAEYEDTGLTPEEIDELKDENEQLKYEAKDFKQIIQAQSEIFKSQEKVIYDLNLENARLKDKNRKLHNRIKDLEEYEIEVGTVCEKNEYLEAENKKLKEKNEYLEVYFEQLKKQYNKLMKDVIVLGEAGNELCDICKYGRDWKQCSKRHEEVTRTHERCFEWRGLEADNEV